MKYFIFFSFILLSPTTFCQQVANYSSGVRGTDDFEEFSFWARNNARAEIYYRYGKVPEEVKLTYGGRTLMRNRQCFKVKFPNGYELLISPKDQGLRVMDEDENYNKIFQWEYEGPVDGVGTACDICTKDEWEALVLIKAYFI